VQPEYVTVTWSLPATIDTSEWTRVVQRSRRVVVEWDDGDGKTIWYKALRCSDERAMRRRLTALLGVAPTVSVK